MAARPPRRVPAVVREDIVQGESRQVILTDRHDLHCHPETRETRSPALQAGGPHRWARRGMYHASTTTSRSRGASIRRLMFVGDRHHKGPVSTCSSVLAAKPRGIRPRDTRPRTHRHGHSARDPQRHGPPRPARPPRPGRSLRPTHTARVRPARADHRAIAALVVNRGGRVVLGGPARMSIALWSARRCWPAALGSGTVCPASQGPIVWQVTGCHECPWQPWSGPCAGGRSRLQGVVPQPARDPDLLAWRRRRMGAQNDIITGASQAL